MNRQDNTKYDYEHMLYEVRCPQCGKLIAKADGTIDSICPRCGNRFGFTSPNSRNLLNRLQERETSHLDLMLRHSNASDLIVVNEKCNSYFMALWEAKVKSSSCPSDIIFSHTVPLTDCVIVVNEKIDDDYSFRFRVMALQDTISNIVPDEIDDADEIVVGAMKMYVNNRHITAAEAEIIVPLIVIKGNNCILIPRRDIESELLKYCRDRSVDDLSEWLRELFKKCLNVWYGIQIALLHPVVKEVFRKPEQAAFDPERDKEVHLQSGNKIYDRRYKHIKKRVISPEEIQKTAFGNKREINRKATIWFVCGHWRVLSSGIKTFVRPHLRGRDRDKYIPVMNERDRDIAVSEEAVNTMDKAGAGKGEKQDHDNTKANETHKETL